MAEEVILAPLVGMNQDDSPLGIVAGEGGQSDFAMGGYRYALNLRVGNTSNNNSGAGENIPSTLLVNNYYVWSGAWVAGSAQAGVNTAINSYSDRSAGVTYWCVHNSNGNHAILFYIKSEQKIYELLMWSGLNFLLTNFVSMTKINKYLLLTDGNPADGTGNPPRCIDVTTVFTLKSTLGSGFSEYHISLSKWAPVEPPYVDTQFVSDGNVFIAKGIYQFAYRYIYKGGFRSTWSPPSNFVSNELRVVVNPNNWYPLPDTIRNFCVHTPGFIFDSNTPTNTAFDHTDIRFYDFIDFIEYAYRDSEIANWKTFSRMIVSGSVPPLYVEFGNNGPISNVAANDIGQYFDSVPLLSRTIESIDNRPMLGNNLDDLPPMSDFAVTDVAVYSVQNSANNWFNDVSALVSALRFQRFSFKENGIYKLGIIFKHYSGRSGLVQTRDNWTYTIPVNNATAVLCQEDFHALGFKIGAGLVPPIWAVDYQIVRSNCLNIESFIVGVINDYKFLKIDTSGTDNSLATSQAVQDAFNGYYDNYNNGGAQYNLINRILTAMRKNQSATFAACTIIYIDISNWYLDTVTDTGTPSPPNPSNNLYYNWQPGDRVRFWGSKDSSFDNTTTWYQFDAEILEFTGTGVFVSKPIDLVTLQTRATSGGYQLFRPYTIEVYRPKKYSKDNDVIFYEMGEWYPVTQPGTSSRAFSKTDFTWSGSGSVTTTTVAGKTIYHKYPIINGDVWLVTKQFAYNYGTGFNGIGHISLVTLAHIGDDIKNYPVFPQMNQDKNNAAGFWEHNVGRPLVAYNYLPVQFEKSTQIRFGGKFLEDSIFIGINNFQDDNQKIYPSEYGKIRAMVNTSNTQVKDVGQILMVICEEETMDVYVNRATLQSLGGQTNVTLSDQVLGSYNTLLGSFGTLNPESVSKRNSRVLFWNAKQGRWIRRSVDGLTPISDNKMYNWFNDLSLLLIDTYSTNTPAKVTSVYDSYYDEWVTQINHSSLPSIYRGYPSYKCASFNEGNKRWATIYDYAPDLFASLDNETYSIIGTVVHIHYGGADFGSIYGVKKDCLWQPVANPEFRVTKVWRAINEQSTDKWSFPSIDGDFKSNGVTAQNSALLLTDLENREGTFWADIKRDLNTINASDSDQAIVNGDPMRSRALTLMLKLDSSVTWYSFINWLVVTFDRSEKTAKK